MALRRLLCAGLVTVLAVIGFQGAALAGAPDAPELRDPCGPAEEIGSDTLPELAPEWADVCAAWFTTVSGESGPPAITVSLQLAGDITERPAAATYYLSWRVGDCLYSIGRRDPGTLLGESQQFGFRCGPSTREVPCQTPSIPPGATCSETIPQTYTPVPDEVFVEDGNVLTATLVFTAGLARHAAAHSAGATLTKLSASAAGPAGVFTACTGNDCGYIGTDTASNGADYVIEPGAGIGVQTPIVPEPEACTAGSVDQASAERPHVLDREGDSALVTVDNPDAEEDGYDIRAIWFSRAVDGLDLHILPAGPADAAETSYSVDFNGHTVRVEGQPDGTWQALAGPEPSYPQDLPDDGLTATGVTVDATSGEVVVSLPDALLPAEQVLTIDAYYSHYLIGGAAPRPEPVAAGSHSVDDTGGGLLCAAQR